MRRVVLLLDFDGVLVDSPAHITEITCDVANKFLFFLPSRCKILEKIFKKYSKLREGRSKSTIGRRVLRVLLYPIIKAWNDTRIKYTHVLPGVEEALRELKKNGVVIILFSAHDWIKGYKELRFKRTGLDRYFDDIVSFEGKREQRELLQKLLREYPDATFIWVDDRPNRFLEFSSDRIVPVWFQFPTTMDIGMAVESLIPNLRKVKNWRELKALVKEYLRLH